MTPGLIERLEKAEGGSRELDWRIADLTGHPSFERKVEGLWPPFAERSRSDSAIPAYTTSLDAALALAERVLPGCGWSVCMDDRMGWYLADIGKDHFLFGGEPSRSIGRTPTLALTAAILKARATQEQG